MYETKTCPKCKVEKPLVLEPPKNDHLIGFSKGQFEKKSGICRSCYSGYIKIPEIKEKRKNYHSEYTKRPEIKKKTLENNKIFKQKHGVLPCDYSRKKRIEKDPVECLKIKISSLVRVTFRTSKFTKNSRTAKILCCSYEEFYNHLTNNGEIAYDPKKHHLDHIIPVSLARNEEECIVLNHYKNFRLLTKEKNLAKSNKLPSIFELNPGLPDLAFQVYMRNV